MLIYCNGSIIPPQEVRISPFDHGFMYGLGLFETFRTYQGHPFLLDDHFQRLHDGLKNLRINVSQYDRRQVTEIIQKLLKENELTDAYFRWNVSAGEGPIGLSTSAYSSPNTIVFIKELPSKATLEKKLVVLSQPRNTPEGKERLKSHHFLNNIYGKLEIADERDAEGLFLTAEGYVAEGVVSNVFWRQGENVFTPSVNCGILNGVTRQFVIRLIKSLGYSVHEGFYPLSALLEAEEVMITNSIQEIVSISSAKGHPFAGHAGLLYKELSAMYANVTETQLLWSRDELSKR